MLLKVTGGRVTVNDPAPRVIKLGTAGPAGAPGTTLAGFGTWSSGTSTYPAYSVVSYNGSSYISNAAAYSTDVPGASSKWVLLASKGDTGSTGATGASILTGTGSPSVTSPSSGSNGDYFFATDTKTLYGPKASNTWPGTGTSLKGDTGATGATGPQGVQGDTGPTGATGATGATGSTGATGAAGSSGVVSVTSPITNSGTSSAANIGLAASGVTANTSTTMFNSVQVDTYGRVVAGVKGLQTAYTPVTTTSYTVTGASSLIRVTAAGVSTLVIPTAVSTPAGTVFWVRNDRTAPLAIQTTTGFPVAKSLGRSATIMLACDGSSWINFGISQSK